MDIFSAPHFRNDEAARKFLEDILWPDGPACPYCGVIGHAYETKRAGVYRCAETECRKDFTVTMKTVMERSHIALHKWLMAFHLMTSSKKGVSAHQLHRTLGITYRSAWFMEHRIREAMRAGGLAPMGGAGGVVEADKTFIGRKEGSIKRCGHGHKNAVLSLVDRKTKQVRSFHVEGTSAANIVPIIKANVAKETAIMTDEGGHCDRQSFCPASETAMRKKRDKNTKKSDHRLGNIKEEVPEKQLSAIGALALAFNEVEANLDRLFFEVTGLDEHLQLEVSTRIGGIDGKLAIIKRGAEKILDNAEFVQLS
jgi:transposase-like protein